MITVGKVFDMHRESVVQDARQHPEDPLVPAYLEFLEEEKLEVVCDIKLVKKVITKLREVHPYEEPAIDIIPLLDENIFE